jgi:signal transduction histidine kinase
VEELERLRVEVAALRASRERLVLATDAERHRIERDLHAGVQQRLVALAVALQLADAESPAVQLEAIRRDVQQALDETAALAERISPPLLEAGGLAAALRAAAVRANTSATVDVVPGLTCPPHVARTVYWCWLEMLAHGAAEGRPTIAVRQDDHVLTFVVAGSGRPAAMDALCERVDALGGRLTIEAVDDGIRVGGELPLAG